MWFQKKHRKELANNFSLSIAKLKKMNFNYYLREIEEYIQYNSIKINNIMTEHIYMNDIQIEYENKALIIYFIVETHLKDKNYKAYIEKIAKSIDINYIKIYIIYNEPKRILKNENSMVLGIMKKKDGILFLEKITDEIDFNIK